MESAQKRGCEISDIKTQDKLKLCHEELKEQFSLVQIALAAAERKYEAIKDKKK